MIKAIKSHTILVILTPLITLGVLVFNVFHYSSSYGIVEINSFNSLLLVPFIVLVCWLGMLLGVEVVNSYSRMRHLLIPTFSRIF